MKNIGLERALRRIEECQSSGSQYLSLRTCFLEELPHSLGELVQLETLDLQTNRFTNLNLLLELPNLKSINLQSNKLIKFPVELLEMGQLEELDIGSNLLTSLPDSISELGQLKRLSFDCNSLSDLPVGLGKLCKLESLTMGMNKIQALPNAVTMLQALKYLSLGGNQLNLLPDAIGDLSQELKHLDLYGNQLTSLPESFSRLTRLQSLSLGGNPMASLPLPIASLVNLTDLVIASMSISELPSWISNFEKLESLMLDNNPFTGFPSSIGKLKALKNLWISECGFSEMPKNLELLENLGNLGMCDSNLSCLPEEFGELSKLKDLWLSGNKFSRVPECIKKLSALESLDLSENKISEIPDWLITLDKLKSIDLSCNEITSWPKTAFGWSHINIDEWENESHELKYAAGRGDREVILEELNKGIDINLQNWNSSFIEQVNKSSSQKLKKSCLMFAAASPSAGVDILQLLIDRGANVNAVGGEIVADSALGLAMKSACIEKTKFLLAHGANPNLVPQLHWVHLACFYPEQLSEFLDLFLASANPCQLEGEALSTSLLELSKLAKFHLVLKLLDFGARKSDLQWSDLMWSIVYGSVDDVKAILESGEFDWKNTDSVGRTAWMLSTQVHDLEKPKLLLSYGADIEEVDGLLLNAISTACVNDNVDTLAWLLKQGLDPNQVGRFGVTHMSNAAISQAIGCAKLLLESGVDPKASKDADYDFAVSLSPDMKKGLEFYLSERTDLKPVKYDLLARAVSRNDISALKRVLEEYQDFAPDELGEELFVAFRNDSLSVAELLLEAGANISLYEYDDGSVLHLARSKKAIDLALTAGIDLNLKDCLDRSAEHVLQGNLKKHLKMRIGYL